MGNCFKRQGSDDMSLLRGAEQTSTRDSSDPIPSTSRDAIPSTPRGHLPTLSRIQPQLQPNVQTTATARPPNNILVYYPSPNVRRRAEELSEEEQIKIAKRIGLIQHLPTQLHDGSRSRECIICMAKFLLSDPVRFLPCLHMYHRKCIDEWLMRSFTCPICMEPVDAALLNSYETNAATN